MSPRKPSKSVGAKSPSKAKAAETGLSQLSKAQRQHQVSKLVTANNVSSQVQLVNLLKTHGVEATQATVSRDLEELGAIKVRAANGHSLYAIPEGASATHAPEADLKKVLSEWVIDLERSGDLIVIRTPPAIAHVVASALDNSSNQFLAGTIAGDDTVLAVAKTKNGNAAKEWLLAMTGIGGVVDQ